MHLSRGDYATVTGVRFGAEHDFQRAAEAVARRVRSDRPCVPRDRLQRVRHADAHRRHSRLTDRERECLRHSADGLSAKEISRIIDRSVPTVVMHINSAIRKLGARNRTQAWCARPITACSTSPNL